MNCHHRVGGIGRYRQTAQFAWIAFIIHNSATRPPDRCLMVLRPVPNPRVVTGDGVALLGIDANCHGPLSQGGLPLRAIWHNEKCHSRSPQCPPRSPHLLSNTLLDG